jgi:hypothetical protein
MGQKNHHERHEDHEEEASETGSCAGLEILRGGW